MSILPKIELINMHKEKGKIFSDKTQSEILALISYDLNISCI